MVLLAISYGTFGILEGKPPGLRVALLEARWRWKRSYCVGGLLLSLLLAEQAEFDGPNGRLGAVGDV